MGKGLGTPHPQHQHTVSSRERPGHAQSPHAALDHLWDLSFPDSALGGQLGSLTGASPRHCRWSCPGHCPHMDIRPMPRPGPTCLDLEAEPKGARHGVPRRPKAPHGSLMQPYMPGHAARGHEPHSQLAQGGFPEKLSVELSPEESGVGGLQRSRPWLPGAARGQRQ